MKGKSTPWAFAGVGVQVKRCRDESREGPRGPRVRVKTSGLADSADAISNASSVTSDIQVMAKSSSKNGNCKNSVFVFKTLAHSKRGLSLIMIYPTVSRAGVEPVVDFEGAGFTGDSCGHRLVGVILILREEYIQRRGGDNLRSVLGILRETGNSHFKQINKLRCQECMFTALILNMHCKHYPFNRNDKSLIKLINIV